MSADQGISGVQQGNQKDRLLSLHQYSDKGGGWGEISKWAERKVHTLHQRASEFFQYGEAGHLIRHKTHYYYTYSETLGIGRSFRTKEA